MLKQSSILLILLLLFQSCGGSGGGGGTSGPSDSGNTPFQPDGPSRDDYTVPSPIDALANYQWHLDNKGLKYYTQISNTAGEDINHETARNNAWSGHGVLIAVSDNGTQTSHPDLFSNILSQYERNYSSDDPGAWHSSAYPSGTDASSAHGTAVAGLIAAIDGNNEGGMGVAPRSKLAVFRYVGTGGNLNKAIDQANGPFHIFNYSYGRSSCSFIDLPQSLIDQFKYGVENLRDGKGAIYVKAAGNEYISGLDDCVDGAQGNYYGNANLEEEHSTPYMIVVGAFNADGISSSYSTPGSSLWIVAPGGEFGVDRAAVISTDLVGCDSGMANSNTSYTDFDKGVPENSDCSYTNTMNGSSAATPIVSGSVALILEANPNLSWREVKHIIAKTARKIDPNRNVTPHPQGANLQNHTYQDAWLTNSSGYHFHNWYGFGAIDVSAAVQMAQSYTNSLPSLQETNWVNSKTGLNLSIPDSNATGVTDSMYVNNELTIEAVQIKITLDHTYTGDLGVELTSPSGMKSILMNINSNILETNLSDALLLSNAFYGESSKGTWTLKVIDGAPADTGALKGWKLNFFGHTRNSGNLLTKTSTLETSLGNSKNTKEGGLGTQSKIDISTFGKDVSKIKWTKTTLSASERKYTFELKFKNKIASVVKTETIEELDQLLDENGDVKKLTKKDSLHYLQDQQLDEQVTSVPWYKNNGAYAVKTSDELIIGTTRWKLPKLSSVLYKIGNNWTFFTEDKHQVTLKMDGSSSIKPVESSVYGVTLGGNDEVIWSYAENKLQWNEQRIELKNIKSLEVYKNADELIIPVIDNQSFKIFYVKEGVVTIKEYSGLSYLKNAKIKDTKRKDNVLYILYESDSVIWHLGIELYEE